MNSTTALKEREMAGLQYLGGYVLHKLYKKHARASSRESQQAMALLKAGKMEHTGDSNQKLISSLNRGGLWSITGPAQKIFFKTESWFRQLTPNVDLQGVDLAGITHKAISDSDILANFNLMVTDAMLDQIAMSARRFCMALLSYMYGFRHFLLLRMLFKNIRSKQNNPRRKLYAGKLLGAKVINNQGRSDRKNHM